MKKILIIRGSSIGDIVLTTPVIRCIKLQIPNAEIHFLVKPQNAVLVENNPYVNKVHLFQKNISQTIAELKNENFDFIVDLQKNLRTLRIKISLNVPSGTFPKLNLKKWLLVRFKINLLPNIHVVDRYFIAAKKLNIANDSKGLDYFIHPADNVAILDIKPYFNQPFIAFVIGSKHQTKQLTDKKIIEICDNIQYPIVLLGDKNDFTKGEEIIKHSTNKTIFNTAGKYNLNQSASWLQQAKLVITNDTGLMHIASALKVNIISVWGNTVPAFGMYPYLPANSKTCNYIIENEDIKCRPCSKLGFNSCPKKHFNCINTIDTIKIAELANKIMSSN